MRSLASGVYVVHAASFSTVHKHGCRNLWETVLSGLRERHANCEHLERNCCTTHHASVRTPIAPIFCKCTSGCSGPGFLSGMATGLVVGIFSFIGGCLLLRRGR